MHRPKPNQPPPGILNNNNTLIDWESVFVSNVNKTNELMNPRNLRQHIQDQSDHYRWRQSYSQNLFASLKCMFNS